MAPHEILIGVASVVTVFFLLATVLLVFRSAERVKDAYRQGYSEGFDKGVTVARDTIEFTLDKSERVLSDKADVEQIYEYNVAASKDPPPELLLAYGVDSVKQLPKDVRESYGLEVDDERRIEDLIT